MKINEEEGEKQLQIWRNRPRLNITDAMHTAAEQSALQAIGHITLTGASDEQMEAFEDEYNRVIRALLNDTPFT